MLSRETLGYDARVKTLVTLGASVAVGLACVVSQACGRNGSVEDGFDAGVLSSHWDDRKLVPGGLTFSSAIARAGSGAALFTLRPGDQIAQERGTILERAEIEESESSWSVEETTYRYTFSLQVPQDFPRVPVRVVLAQWKQECPIDSCTPDNPLIALRYEDGVLFLTQQASDRRQTLYETRDDVRGRWLDFEFLLRFSRTAGLLQASMDGKRVADYSGPTAYPAAGGYDSKAQFYFKTGLYRDSSRETMTLYFDEYRKDVAN